MKKQMLGPAVLFVFVLAAFLGSFVINSKAEPAASEEATTLQMIASYRTWGKANVAPITVPVEQAATGG